MSSEEGSDWMDDEPKVKKTKTSRKSLSISGKGGDKPKRVPAKSKADKPDKPEIPDKKNFLRLKDVSIKHRLLQTAEAHRADAILAKRSHSGVPRALRLMDGEPIVKKRTNKQRYLLSFPGTMEFDVATVSGQIGTLARLDTYTPCMYLDFPEGRAKLAGHQQYITSNITALACEKDGLVVVDQFDHLIVFSELSWIGTIIDNPDEKPLRFPQDLLQKYEHGISNTSTSTTTTKNSNNNNNNNNNDDDDIDIDKTKEAEANAVETTTPKPRKLGVRKSSREAASSRKSYTIPDSDEDEIDEDADDISSDDGATQEVYPVEEEKSPLRKQTPQKPTPQKPTPQSKTKAKARTPAARKNSRTTPKTISVEDSDQDEEDQWTPHKDSEKTTPAKSQRSSRRSVAKKASYIELSSDDDNNNNNNNDDDDNGGGGGNSDNGNNNDFSDGEGGGHVSDGASVTWSPKIKRKSSPMKRKASPKRKAPAASSSSSSRKQKSITIDDDDDDDDNDDNNENDFEAIPKRSPLKKMRQMALSSFFD